MEKSELKKLKMHLQGAMDCLAQYEMADSDDGGNETDDEEPSAADSAGSSDAGMNSLKMKMLAFKNKG